MTKVLVRTGDGNDQHLWRFRTAPLKTRWLEAFAPAEKETDAYALLKRVRRTRAAETARRRVGHRWPGRVSPASRTGGNIARGIQPEVRPKDAKGVGGGAIKLVLRGVLLRGGIQLPKVIDASIRLGPGSDFQEIGNRNRRQQANNSHDNHDFHQREARLS